MIIKLTYPFLSVSFQSRSMIQAKDYDGGRRLGRLALLLSVVSIVVGTAIVLYLVITGKLLFFSTTQGCIVYKPQPS